MQLKKCIKNRTACAIKAFPHVLQFWMCFFSQVYEKLGCIEELYKRVNCIIKPENARPGLHLVVHQQRISRVHDTGNLYTFRHLRGHQKGKKLCRENGSTKVTGEGEGGQPT